MNRAERRASAQKASATYSRVQADLVRQAQETRAWILASDEPLAERVALVDAAIAELEADPLQRLIAKPVVEILRGLRGELTGPVH